MLLPHAFRFAGDATLPVLASLALLSISALATLGDRRRTQRRDLDAVGWVPWRDLAAYSAIAALVTLAISALIWLRA